MKKLLTILFALSIHFLHSQNIVLSLLQPDCHHDGSIQAQVYGITPPYDIIWYDAPITPYTIVATHTNVTTATDQVANLVASAYVAQVKQGNTVIATSQTLTVPSVLHVTNPFGIITTYSCPASTASIFLNITGGVLPYNVQWDDGFNLVATGNPGLLTEGYYNYTVTDANNCIFRADGAPMAAIPVTVYYHSGMTDTLLTTAANCTNGTAHVANVTGGTAPYTYLWQNGATTSAITNQLTGPVSVRLTDANGCYLNKQDFIAQAVTINRGFTTTDASCMLSNGSATVMASGGLAPYTYHWSNSQSGTVIGSLSPGTYACQVTDANGCISDPNGSYVPIYNTSPITVTYTSSVSQCTTATGSSTLTLSGGTAPYTVTWSTLPLQSGSVIANVAPGQYPFVITDANGCQDAGTVYVGTVSGLGGSMMTSAETCNAGNGSALMNMYSLFPPYTYQWSTNATTPSVTNLHKGNYVCTVTDASGCKLTKNAEVQNTSPLSITFTDTPSSCLFSNNGSIQATVSNGTAPYTYHWSNGAVTANATLLTSGDYYLTVTDAMGCVTRDYHYLDYNHANTSCYCVITGAVFDDANANCTQDPGEAGIPNVMMQCSGIGYVYTNMNGAYSFTVPSGPHVVTEYLSPNMNLGTCQNLSQSVVTIPSSGCVVPLNFANALIPVHSLHVLTTSVNNAVPGNTYQQEVIICNEGTYAESNVQLSYAHDGQLGYAGSSPALQPAGTNPDLYSSVSLPAISPNASSSILLTYDVPTTIPLGTLVNVKDTVAALAPVAAGWLNDYTPWDNVNNYNAVIVGSFDPNFKEVTPKGTGPYGVISNNDTILEYVIHFQNTGTYMAQKVVVKDSLDHDLAFMSFKPGYSDYHYAATMDNNGVVTFTFEHIDLPYNYPASTGMVSYRIKTKKNLAPGTEFLNKAAIFFDYNAPVITNTTINSLDMPSAVAELEDNKQTLKLYPNPAGNTLHIALPSGKGCLMLMDVLGNVLLSEQATASGEMTLDVKSLQSGIYIARFINDVGQVSTAKLIKQ